MHWPRNRNRSISRLLATLGLAARTRSEYTSNFSFTHTQSKYAFLSCQVFVLLLLLLKIIHMHMLTKNRSGVEDFFGHICVVFVVYLLNAVFTRGCRFFSLFPFLCLFVTNNSYRRYGYFLAAEPKRWTCIETKNRKWWRRKF